MSLVDARRPAPGQPLVLDRLQPLQHHERRLRVSDTDGTEVRVHVLMGAQPRPCLALVAGVHGDEYDGILALQGVVQDVAADLLAGSLLVIPVANPLAFGAAARHTPEDGRDLNRAFPGNPNGTVTERLASLLCDNVLTSADLVFSLHGARATSTLLPWMEFLDVPGELGARSLAAARASGFAHLVALPPLPGRLMTAMAARGIPLIEGELGGRGEATSANVGGYRSSVERLAQRLGVLRGALNETLPEPQFWDLHEITSPAAGIFLTNVDLGASVQQGDVLGRVLDSAGNALAVIRAPLGATVAGMRVHAGVTLGDGLFALLATRGASDIGNCVASDRGPGGEPLP
jgi:predicted deacylase